MSAEGIGKEEGLKRSTVSVFVPNYEIYRERTLEKDEEENLVRKANKLASKVENSLNLGEDEKIRWTAEISPKMSKKQEDFEVDLFLEKKNNDIRNLQFAGGKYAPSIDQEIIKNLSAEEIDEIKKKYAEIGKNRLTDEVREIRDKFEKSITEKLLSKMKNDFRRASINCTVTIEDNNDVKASLGNIGIITNREGIFLKGYAAMNLEDAANYIAKYLNDELKKEQNKEAK